MINFKFVRFTLVVNVSHKVNVLVTDIILNITSQEHLIFTSLHIDSRLFELFSKEVLVNKQPGMHAFKTMCAQHPTFDISTRFRLYIASVLSDFIYVSSTGIAFVNSKVRLHEKEVTMDEKRKKKEVSC